MVKVITAIVLGLSFVAAIWWMPIRSFNILLMVIILLGAVEYCRMFLNDPVERWAAVVAIIAAATSMFYGFETAAVVPATLALTLFALSMIFMWRAQELEGIAGQLGIATLGLLYLGIAFPFWGWLRELDRGNSIVLLAIAPACLCDTMGFLAGKSFGRCRFAPKVSPNKTWEGFVGALVGSLIGSIVIWQLLLPLMKWYYVIGLALVIWITSPFGDLIESMFKRSCGVKDSGAMIPGHGGILDRLDALIFTAPAAFLYMKYVVGW